MRALPAPRSFGTAYKFDGHLVHAFPTPQRLATVTAQELVRLGMGFKAKTIVRLARELRKHLPENAEWRAPAAELIEQLCAVKGVGSWTARVAVADFRGDWSQYPFGDLAVRKWAKQYLPEMRFPKDPPAFHDKWLSLYDSHAGMLAFYITTIGTLGGR